jgi:tRNA threonylcarbamoyladenosine biosynthesis protein TsaB
MTTATPPAPSSPLLPLLALDTSGTTARVGLFSADGARLAGGERTGQRHSAYLLPLCHDTLTAAGVSAAQLGALACGRGPGSFTGLRVGLAVAKGLALPFDLPLALVSSLEALAIDLLAGPLRAAPGGERPLLAPVIDAGKGEVYVQLFAAAGQAVRAVSEEQRLHPHALVARIRSEAGPRYLAGSGLDRHRALFDDGLRGPGVTLLHDFAGPTADAVARLARPRLARGERDDLAAAVPSYGRPPDITTPKRPPTG